MKKYNIKVNGKAYDVEVEEVYSDGEVKPVVTNVAPVAAAPKAEAPKAAAPAGGNAIKAPMPGNIVKVNVKPGDSVKKGAVVLVLEAMKMENDITAPADCVIASVPATQGSSVNSGDTLVTYN